MSSQEVKCPYCPEVRPSRSRLQTHIDGVHRHADTRENRRAAALSARTVEDVVTDLDDLSAANPLDVPALCICGEPIEQPDADEDPTWWTHRMGAKTPCTEPMPVKRTLAAQGRTSLTERLADTGKRLDKAGDEIRDLKAKADAVLARLEALDAQAMSPQVVRRATLNQVWDKLMDAGNITGAQEVMKMIGRLSEGDWS
jgi:hypothetical protein